MVDFLYKHPLQLLLALVFLGIVLRLVFSRSHHRYEPKPLLTQNEMQFYHVLLDALPEFMILPQVAMNAFLKPPSGLSARRYASTRGTFAQKHVDFLICEARTLRIMAILELDDRSHTADKDQARDKITGSAGYRTLRFHSRNKPSKQKIQQELKALLEAAPGRRVLAY